MSKPDKVYNFISWQDITLFMWGGFLLVGYAIIRFIRWFSTREIANFWGRIEKQIAAAEARLEIRLDDMNASIMEYKSQKHNLQNENIGLKSTIEICTEAIDKANECLEKINNIDKR